MTSADATDTPESAPEGGSRSGAGVAGNERLTALTGAVLLVLFAVEIVTLIQLRGLMPLHFFVGVLLIGPVAVKTASTGWRFVRYYARHPAYRRKGPPNPVMRVLSPLLLLFTVAVIGSGVALAFTGPAPPVLLKLHVVSFLGWLALILVHVAVYVSRVPRLIAEDWRTRRRPGTPPEGRAARLGANAAALVAAAIPAALLLPAATVWAGWLEQPVTGPGVVAITLSVILALALAFRRGRRR
ncbi:hypothetical protein [Sinomonas albida]|uniref:hypothetical protein n=1 Tax=Sinomonas albida TaxID=369942 RepID=UPI0010A79E15|nr:hypothetical protein [Sinomonas albida]